MTIHYWRISKDFVKLGDMGTENELLFWEVVEGSLCIEIQLNPIKFIFKPHPDINVQEILKVRKWIKEI